MRPATRKRSIRRSRGAVLAVLAAAALGIAGEHSARADGVGVSFEMSGDAVLVPGNNLHVGTGTHVGPRPIGGDLRLNSNVFYAGAGMGVGLLTRHFVIPLASLDFYSAAGLYDEQRTSIDGSIAHLRPWTGNIWDLGIGGFGFRTDVRRWTLSATARTGFTLESVGADAAWGNGTYDLGTGAINPYLRLDLEACRRLDPLERVCLVVSPNVYAYDQTFHGGMLSFRYELGK
jgi:hypothetical protein